MKCHRCPKQATLHITEVLPESKYEEVHLCEECAKKYLYAPQAAKKPGKASILESDPSGKCCPLCGLKFVEFRNSGRLGCPHDYDAFREELIPLLQSIHADVRHTGKTPRRAPMSQGLQAELTELRKRLHQAIQQEDYEDAAKLRDRIRQLEESE